MRITNASGVRNDLLQTIADRALFTYAHESPLPISFDFVGALGNHAGVVRSTYTVPPNKRALVSGLSANMSRSASATAAASSAIQFIITPDGGAGVLVFHCQTTLWTTANFYDRALATNYLLRAGDVIESNTSSNSTGGTVRFNLSAAIQEFDA